MRLWSRALSAWALFLSLAVSGAAKAQQPPAAQGSPTEAGRAAARDNPFAPAPPRSGRPPAILDQAAPPAAAQSARGLSYVGRIDGRDVYLFKEGRCYVEAEGDRHLDSGCYRAHQRFLRDDSSKR